MADTPRKLGSAAVPRYGAFSLLPADMPRVETPHRRIVTSFPVPESIEVFEKLQRNEPQSMSGQPPILWDRAEGAYVFDRFGNRWIDWSSCVLVANVGHAHPRIEARIRRVIERPLLATYVFAHEERAELVERLVGLAPDGLDKAFLLTTGSEAVENAIKLMRTWGLRQSAEKRIIVSFGGSFHGRTLGSQMAGGIPALKAWIGGDDKSFVQVPFPDGYLLEDTSFEQFERTLQEAGVDPTCVAGVVAETFLGVGPDFFPPEYAQALRRWCDIHGALLAFDEVQGGFGRSGKLFAFEHYGIVPDLIACGKGISGSLPLAAVIGRSDVMDTYPAGSMTSTHSGSPLCAAAANGAIEALLEERLVERAASMEKRLQSGLEAIRESWSEIIGCVRARGLVGGVRIVRPGTREPNPEIASLIVEGCVQRGLLMFAPVGLGGGCIKIAPPLVISEGALEEGLQVLAEVFQVVVGS